MNTQRILPKDYNGIVYQIIRPTGLLDPIIDIRPISPESFTNLKKEIQKYGYTDMTINKLNEWNDSQVTNLIQEILINVQKKQRTLVLTLTKRMAEELSEFFQEKGIRSKYIHSEIDTIERVDILKNLRTGEFDVLIGINLLREGLDLPEVSLIGILDADKEGFLRSKTSLIQIIGRAARHEEGRVIMYADRITESIKYATDETRRRRKIQEEFNQKHNIIPQSIRKEISNQLDKFRDISKKNDTEIGKQNYEKIAQTFPTLSKKEKNQLIKQLKLQMQIFSDMLEFEKAIQIRDLIREIEKNNKK
ncbi:MAG: helicase-related protein [Candidatus Dojkabacteria bacterium]|nr:helicase-related protein [Candidatus Dojkabacteria bacterium]